eukprot:10373123-Alexandrium_andersonii.AAC.1
MRHLPQPHGEHCHTRHHVASPKGAAASLTPRSLGGASWGGSCEAVDPKVKSGIPRGATAHK